MTAKEQHCPSCGYTEEDAKLHMDHHFCKNSGNAPWEKRGQNAAESLPARQENIPQCPQCKNPLEKVRYPSTSMLNEDQFMATRAGDWFCKCHSNQRGNRPYAYFWSSEVEPVIAVEAKEKSIDLSYEALGYRRDIDGELIEPKPTPSTSKCVNCSETVRFAQECKKGGYCYAAPSANLIELLRPKPQPDSSSISTEQTFEEWWDKLVQPDYFRDMRTIAHAAWNAAKGQSDGR